MGWPQYTTASHATTLASNQSDSLLSEVPRHWSFFFSPLVSLHGITAC